MALPNFFDGTGPGQIINWASPATAQDVRAWIDVEIQVVSNPGTAYTPQRSLDGTNYVACNAYDKDGNAVPTITTAGIYSLDGGGWLKLTGGTGSTFTLRAGA